MRRGSVIGGIAMLAAAAALCTPYALAAGGSTADQGYPCATAPAGASCNGSNGVAGTANAAGSPKPAGQVAAVSHAGGTLPFTGLQLGVFVALGVLLIGGGLVLRLSGRRRSNN